MLAQAADEQVAAATLAVLWNGGTVAEPSTSAEAILATLLEGPFAELGSDDPALHASLVAHAVVGRMADHLQGGVRPAEAEAERITAFCLAGVRPTPSG